MHNSIHVVVVSSPIADVTIIEEALATAGMTCSSFSDRETSLSTTYVIAEKPEMLPALQQSVADALSEWGELLSRLPEVSSAVIAEEDWSESWKRHFHTFRASRRLIVKPSWETYQAQVGEVILSLDPGMCFGTGHHGTTLACLQFLDEFELRQGPMSFLDAGCGSGILSLGARLLGYHPVCGFDHDPQAVAIARENLSLAGIDDVNLSLGTLGGRLSVAPCRLVAANILATVLLEHAEDVLPLVDRSGGQSGHLILAGILTEQYPQVLERYRSLGARELDRKTINEWTSGLFQLDPA